MLVREFSSSLTIDFEDELLIIEMPDSQDSALCSCRHRMQNEESEVRFYK